MPATYNLIASTTLSSTAAYVTFSAIPATYTDLVLKVSIRNDQPLINDQLEITFDTNGSNTAFSRTQLLGDGSTATSARQSNQPYISFNGVTGNNATSNTFTNGEFYIPNYASSSNKPVSVFTANETNAAAVNMLAVAGLWRNSNAVSTIRFSMGGASPTVYFVSGSSFFLYGIKNS